MKEATKENNRGMRRFPAQLWDQMQFFFQEYNDHQLHAVIYFRGLIDRERIRKAVLLSMEASAASRKQVRSRQKTAILGEDGVLSRRRCDLLRRLC